MLRRAAANLLIHHKLPALNYPIYSGVPPLMSPKQLDLHYNKHHATYVNKLNAMVVGVPLRQAAPRVLGRPVRARARVCLGTEYEGQPLDAIVKHTHGNAEKAGLFNNAAQHWNHSFFWACLKPYGDKAMPRDLSNALIEKWGDLEKFRAEFELKATTNFGSGWTWLVYDPNSRSLQITNTSNAATPLAQGLVPLLTADVWEHAYYVDYENRRPDYLKQFWNAVDWNFVADNYHSIPK